MGVSFLISAAMSQRPETHDPILFKPKASNIVYIPTYNKGTAFCEEERKKLKLRGLLPPVVESLDSQVARALSQFRSFGTNIEKYIYLQSLQNRNETLFYRLVLDNLKETMPIVYTPTVGEACVKFGSNYRTAQGMYFSPEDKGSIREILDNWPQEEVNIIVVTDGSRILGLGDLGVNGMGIPIGKLSLYVAGSGFPPSGTLPVTFDFGTNNETYLNGPEYLGRKEKRLTGDLYLELIDEFMEAVTQKWPKVLVQFEDFSNDHAFLLLERYREKYLCFNDDIQGTGAVILSGFINSLRLAKIDPNEVKLVFFGAGSAGIGVADMIVSFIAMKTGKSQAEARKQFWFVDSRGMITENRGDTLADHKVPYARKDNGDTQLKSLVDVVKYVKPNALIGLSGQGQSFTEEIITLMKENNESPIIFALSNPTKKAECTATQAYEWTDGKAIFASGSPFDPVEINGKVLVPGQGNNMFIFPGLGFGAVKCNASKVSDEMIVAAAEVLSNYVTDEEIQKGNIYPPIENIREISCKIATKVIEVAKEEGLTEMDIPNDLYSWVEGEMYVPKYV